MPKGINNWNYKDVKDFLRRYGFNLVNTRGSHHYYYAKYDGKERMVTVPFHGKDSIKPKTFNSIITQSGISKKIWLE